MAIFKEGGGGSLLDGNYVDTDKLGTGKGSPQGKKFLTDNQTFDSVDATQVDSGAATLGQVLTADGLGGASWQDGGVTYTTRYYTSSDTWTKPSGLHEVFVACVGAGGGGGSGRRGNAGVNAMGGAGGAGAAVVYRRISDADLGATETVTVGAAGVGASSVTSDATNGSAGSGGGNTSFGSLVVALAGGGGNGATTSSAAQTNPANATSCTPSNMPYVMRGGVGGGTAGVGHDGFDAQNTSAATRGCPGGGGGGYVSSAGTEFAGNNGGGVYHAGSLTAGGVKGTVNGARDGVAGQDNIAVSIMFDVAQTLTYGVGTAGGGGAGESDGVTAAGNGGNAGNYGAGGGGGAGSATGANSGAGGNGGGGLCIVIEVTA